MICTAAVNAMFPLFTKIKFSNLCILLKSGATLADYYIFFSMINFDETKKVLVTTMMK